MKLIYRTITTLALLGAVIVSGNPLRAQGNKDWEFVVAPYFIAAGMDGDIQIANITVPVDVSFSSLLENLELGGMIHFEAQKDRWALLGDFIFMGLGSSGPFQNISSSIDVDQYLGEFGVAYRFGEHGKSISLLGGGRYISLATDIHVGNQFSVSKNIDWVDPWIGTRVDWSISEKISLIGRLDFGGFGIGSDMTVNAAAMFGYQLKENMALYLGYRVTAIDYDQGSGREAFIYDVTMGGILMGASFRF